MRVGLRQVLHALLDDVDELHAHRVAVLGLRQRVRRQRVEDVGDGVLGEPVPRGRPTGSRARRRAGAVRELRLARVALAEDEQQTVDALQQRVDERREDALRDCERRYVRTERLVEDKLGVAVALVLSQHDDLLRSDVEVVALTSRSADELLRVVGHDMRGLGLEANGVHCQSTHRS